MNDIWNWVQALQRLESTKQPHALATIVSVDGSSPRDVGARMVVCLDGQIEGSIGGGVLENQVINDSVLLIKAGKSAELRHYPLCQRTGQCCGGNVDIFIETFLPMDELHIFGAGHVGQSLASTMSGTAFKIHLIDNREEWLNSKNCGESIARHLVSPVDYVQSRGSDWDKSYAVVMTHSHELDFDLIRSLLDRNLVFLGLIGSQLKWAKFQQRLKASGVEERQIQKVTCPIGIIKEGKSPKEIAISTAAQLLRLQSLRKEK